MPMTKHVALLRGINVGGKATIPMKALLALCESLGWSRVVTYLRTGNIVFEASGTSERLEASLESGFRQSFGFSIPAIIRSAARFSSYLDGAPAEAKADPSHLLLFLSKRPPADGALAGLLAKAAAGEWGVQHLDALWVHFPNGIARSRITPDVIDRAIGSPATGRNWNTVQRLGELCKGSA